MKNKGQSTLEYAMLVVCVVAAFISMAVYLKRGVNGRLRSEAEGVSLPFDPAGHSYSFTTTQTGVERTVSAIKASPVDINGNGDYSDDHILQVDYEIDLDFPVTTSRTGKEDF